MSIELRNMPGHIAVKRLADETETEFFVRHFVCADDWKCLVDMPVHRDDSYLFVLLESGYGEMEVDFRKVLMEDSGICVVRPGQVHHNIKGFDATAWVVRISSSSVGSEYAAIFDERMLNMQDFPLTDTQRCRMVAVLQMLMAHSELDRTTPLWNRQASALLELLVCQTASAILLSERPEGKANSRQAEICRQLKSLIAEGASAGRTPSYYAGRLCISESYLNEVVKRSTGFPVSYWIREAIMLEAKRLLCFTSKSAKEIGYELGYDDNIYFTRLFRKHTGMTPLSFRSKHRE